MWLPERRPVALVAVTAAAALLTLIHVSALDAGVQPVAPRPMEATGEGGAQETVFKAGVDLVDLAVTVTDRDGRFVSGLTKNDFVVYDDGKPQEIVTFSSDRVPVSLGILLDVSGSMTDDQLTTGRLAINRLAFELLDSADELFLMEFAGRGRLLQTWTRNRELFSRALARANEEPLQGRVDYQPGVGRTVNYGTSVRDAVATALPLAAKGAHRKKAVLIISDGIDTSSRRTVKQVQEAIRASEVLVYALAVDGDAAGWASVLSGSHSVDTRALRRLTDETGGRTEVVKGFRNLEKATAQLADEFNQQYVIGYASPDRDGRWHSIKVEVRKKKGAKIRARAGYTAS
jgi:Ca-activated chloride channel homolog